MFPVDQTNTISSARVPSISHRRYNPLLDQWVLCSPHRLKRPWQGQQEKTSAVQRARYEPDCYLCPGNLRKGGERNPAYRGTFVFENDFAALSPLDEPNLGSTPSEPRATPSDELFRAEPQRGICRVMCFSPCHDLTVANMSHDELTEVVSVWAQQVSELEQRPGVSYVQVFENKGEVMGCSNPHPHCQIWASENVPEGPRRRAYNQQRYHRQHGRDLLGDYLDRERASGERIVCENELFTALVPFWAVWPFEVSIISRRCVSSLRYLDPEQQAALAELMGRVCRRYDNLFDCSFPYSMGFYGAPKLDCAAADDFTQSFRLHAEYYPPLLRSAAVRKFQVGYEMAADPQRDLTPESAAQRLRDCSEATAT